jgi:hypothetical protein
VSSNYCTAAKYAISFQSLLYRTDTVTSSEVSFYFSYFLIYTYLLCVILCFALFNIKFYTILFFLTICMHNFILLLLPVFNSSMNYNSFFFSLFSFLFSLPSSFFFFLFLSFIFLFLSFFFFLSFSFFFLFSFFLLLNLLLSFSSLLMILSPHLI